MAYKILFLLYSAITFATPAYSKTENLQNINDMKLHFRLHVARVFRITEYLVKNFDQFNKIKDLQNLIEQAVESHDRAKFLSLAELEKLVGENVNLLPKDLDNKQPLLDFLLRNAGNVPGMSDYEKFKYFEIIDKVLNLADDRIEKEFYQSRKIRKSLRERIKLAIDLADKADRSSAAISAEEFGVEKMVPAHEYIKSGRRVLQQLMPVETQAEILIELYQKYDAIVPDLDFYRFMESHSLQRRFILTDFTSVFIANNPCQVLESGM